MLSVWVSESSRGPISLSKWMAMNENSYLMDFKEKEPINNQNQF